MRFSNIEDFKKIPGGISLDKLEAILSELIQFINEKNLNWFEGIELINDLIYLKDHKNERLSDDACELILDWVERYYDSTKLDYISELINNGNEVPGELIKLVDLTFDTLLKIGHLPDVLVFLNNRISTTNNDFEVFEIEDLIESIKHDNSKENVKINHNISEEITKRADNYFEEQREKDNTNLFCALMESIEEHNYCYSISWCLKSEKYISRVKHTKFAGGGRLLVSNISDDIEMTGSAPNNDWVKEFETRIRGLEEYWSLEIKFEKQKIGKLKSILGLSTPEIIKKIKINSIIELEGEEFELRSLTEDLKKTNIDCKLLRKEREIKG